MKKWVRKTGIILFWLCLWQIAAVTTDNHILLVGPVQVVSALLENIVRADFLKIVFCSLGRIGLGFLRTDTGGSQLPFPCGRGDSGTGCGNFKGNTGGILCGVVTDMVWGIEAVLFHQLPDCIPQCLCKHHCGTEKYG